MLEPEIETAKMALTKLESEGFELPENSNEKLFFQKQLLRILM